MIFGRNPLSSALLQLLGLSEGDCGRFRDCHVEMDGDAPVICVYTRNGGGNRNCWHEDNDYGSPKCKHHTIEVEEDELLEVKDGVLSQYKKTGRRVKATKYICEEPDSASCACPGCTIEYRLRKHPNYIVDRDDDFDSTYATIWFSVPEPAREMVAAFAGATPPPAERWASMLDSLRSGDKSSPDAARALAFGEELIPKIQASFEAQARPSSGDAT